MLKLSNFWEHIDETISFIIDKPLKAKYLKIYDTSKGRLRISEIDFLEILVDDYVNVVTFRFLFDYEPSVKNEIARTIKLDRDAVVNKLMVDLNGQLNIHDVPFAGADEIEDIERYRELDDRSNKFRYGSTAAEDIRWLKDWIAAYGDESDEPDIKALETVYRNFLRNTNYNMDYDMLSPKELLREIQMSNSHIPTLQEKPISSTDREKYKDLENEIDASLFEIYQKSEVHWLQVFVEEYEKAENKKANLIELNRLYTLYLIEINMPDTDLNPMDLLKELEK